MTEDTNLFPVFFKTFQTENCIDTLDTETVALSKRPHRVSFRVSHILREDESTKLIRHRRRWLETRVQREGLGPRSKQTLVRLATCKTNSTTSSPSQLRGR